jgi:hypothetical protein
LFNFLKNQEEETDENFVASRGWFEKFKKWSNIHSIHITGETASADTQAATEFPEQITITEQGGYPPNLVFNIDNTGLFWKCLPSKTSIKRFLECEKCLFLLF